MLVIVGFIVVIGSVLGGFMMAGGHVGALIHPSEILTIGGASMGALIVMSPKKVLVGVVQGMLACLKGNPYGKAGCEDLLKLSYELLRLARRDGMLAVEPHVSNPHQSSIFGKYPQIEKNHHLMEFICRTLTPIIDGTVTVDRVSAMLAAELKVLEEEHHAPQGVVAKTADGLPGFGIVAAVMGIVITMEAINGPVEEIGEKVGAALVGTFLGILLSYGFFAPLSVRMEFLGEAEMAYFRTFVTIAEGMAAGVAPKVAIEQACRGLSSETRLNREELEKLFSESESGG
jgi:chemotaxis protein MotA